MSRVYFPLLVGLIAVLALTACSTSEKSETTNDAVNLLQEVEDNNLRSSLQDALEALDSQEGYLARFTLDARGPGNQSTSLLLTLQVDSAGTMQVDLQRALTTRRYVVIPGTDENASRTIVRTDTPSACIASETSRDGNVAADAWLLNDGMDSIFAEAASMLKSEQILAVIKTPDDSDDTPLLERKTRRYTVEAKLDQALLIAREAANSSQSDQPDIPDTVNYSFSGALVLDDATAALLQFDAQLDEPDAGQTAQVSFAVTQWGNVDPIIPPADLESLDHCN